MKKLLATKIKERGGLPAFMKKHNELLPVLIDDYPKLFGDDANSTLRRQVQNKVDHWKQNGVVKYYQKVIIPFDITPHPNTVLADHEACLAAEQCALEAKNNPEPRTPPPPACPTEERTPRPITRAQCE